MNFTGQLYQLRSGNMVREITGMLYVDHTVSTRRIAVRKSLPLNAAIVRMNREIDEIEGDDEQPKDRTYPHSEKCQDGEKPRREIAIGGERGEALWQIADDTRKDEDESEETEAVQGRDRTLCFDSVHR